MRASTEARTRSWSGALARAGGLLAAVGLLMGVDDNNGCTPTPGEETECSVASDCSGVPPIDCTGAWACDTGECVFECGSEPPPTGCYGDQDCANGQVCNAAEICLSPPGCAPGEPCPAVCYGFCVDPPADDGCYGDQDCEDGERCNAAEVCLSPPGCGPGEPCPAVCYGHCVADPPPTTGCYGDQDCKDGERCNAAEICLSPPGCGPGMDCPAVCYGYCVTDPPPTNGCYSDQECGEGTHCSVSDGDCQSPPGCGPGQPCPDVCYGSCVPDAPHVCYSDQDCGAGTHCSVSDGDCNAPPGCDADMGCPAVCTGVCVPDAPGCWSDWDCEDGQRCNTWDYCNPPGGCANGNCLIACQGVCEPKPHPGCESDADCGFGQYCGCGQDGQGMPNGLWCEPTCLPKPYDCNSDADCPDGQCNLVLCEGSAPSCDADDGDCADEAFWPGQCYGYCAPAPPPWECTSHAECESGVCDFVVCEGSSDAADPAFAPCDPSGQSCLPPEPPQPGQCYGFCKDPGQECNSNLDCPGSDVCIGGVCHPVSGDCSADSDCGEGEHCQLGPCPLGPCWYDEATGESHCPECFGQCVPNQPPSGCQADADCAPGQMCAQECMTACPGCAPGQQCPPCETQCFGVCKDANTCGADGVCPDGMTCHCVGSCPECDDCAYSVCKPVQPPPPETCEVDADCADGWVCDHQVCPFFMPCSADEGCVGCQGICKKPDPTPSACMVTGCSGQVCAAEPVYTTCEYWPWYACYQHANCTQLASGACGWEATDAFVECMVSLGNAGFGATPR